MGHKSIIMPGVPCLRSIIVTSANKGYCYIPSLRSKRFRLVSEQRKIEERDSWFWPREKLNKSQKMKVGGGGGEGRKHLQTNPSILKTNCWHVSIKGLFHTERTVWYVTRIVLIFSGCCLFWPARFALQCKSVFFDLFWNVRLLLRLNKGFRSFNLFSKAPPGSE